MKIINNNPLHFIFNPNEEGKKSALTFGMIVMEAIISMEEKMKTDDFCKWPDQESKIQYKELYIAANKIFELLDDYMTYSNIMKNHINKTNIAVDSCNIYYAE